MVLNQVVSNGVNAQNQEIEKTLTFMNDQNLLNGNKGQLRTSVSTICDVYFFAVPLTKKQILDIEKKPGVSSVAPNQPLYVENNPKSQAKIPVLSAPGNQFKKRDRLVADPAAYDDLKFISTPADAPLSTAYLYKEEAGGGVTIFAVDSAANIVHDEFLSATGDSSILEHRIYAMDSLDEPDVNVNKVTCRLSKMVGKECGVARKAKVMNTKIAPWTSSLLDAFGQIANYLDRRYRAGEPVWGYSVMSVMAQWDRLDSEITMRLRFALGALLKLFQVVVVVQAGMDSANLNSGINRWPANAENEYDLIVVGAVEVKTGRMYPYSKAGPFLTVNAPGVVQCAVQDDGEDDGEEYGEDDEEIDGGLYSIESGTDVAAAQVAGVIAYFLSLRDTGPYLRRNPARIPATVKEYIKDTAFKLMNDGHPAIWNLLGGPT